MIIPDFGGFIAHYQPARYIKEENLYLPPVRTIGFNPQLTINDGLLAQSYMQAHHTDFPDATRMIEEEVAGLKEQLYQNGCAEMHGIGVLHYNIHSTYEFHPNEDGALSPTLYGLSSFSITRLEYLTSTTSATTRELLPQQEKRKRTVRFKRQWIGNAVAVAIAVVLFFFLSVPVENTYVDKGNYASLGTDGLFDAIRSQSLATTLITVPSRPQQPKKTNIKNNQNTLKPVTVKVEKVGKDNFAAQITSETKKYKRAESELVNSMKKVTNFTSFVIIPVGIILFVQAYFFRNVDITNSVVSTAAALLGMLPKGLMLLITISLATGVIKLAKKRVLVQDLYSVETLAHIDTLCLDKTGTITEGKMKVDEVKVYNLSLIHI